MGQGSIILWWHDLSSQSIFNLEKEIIILILLLGGQAVIPLNVWICECNAPMLSTAELLIAVTFVDTNIDQQYIEVGN